MCIKHYGLRGRSMCAKAEGKINVHQTNYYLLIIPKFENKRFYNPPPISIDFLLFVSEISDKFGLIHHREFDFALT